MITASLCILAELPGQETRSWEKLRFLIGDSRLFIVTLVPFLRNPRRGQPFGVDQRSANPRFGALWEPVFRMRARLQFFRRIFIANPFDRSTERSLARSRPGGHFLATPVWVILKPLSFSSFPCPRRSLLCDLFASLLNSAARFAMDARAYVPDEYPRPRSCTLPLWPRSIVVNTLLGSARKIISEIPAFDMSRGCASAKCTFFFFSFFLFLFFSSAMREPRWNVKIPTIRE